MPPTTSPSDGRRAGGRLRRLCRAGLRFEWAVLGLGAAVLAAVGLDLPLLRPVLGGAYLVVVPGLVGLGLLEADLELPLALVLATALSAVVVMLVGLVASLALPLVGVSEPLRVEYLLGLLVSVTSAGAALALRRGGDGSPPWTGGVRVGARGAVLSLAVVAVAVTGTTTVLDRLDVALVNRLLVLVVCGVALAVGAGVLRRAAVPVVVWAASAGVVLNATLVSPYVWGWDVHRELFVSRQVVRHGVWTAGHPSNVNTMLTYGTLAPAYSVVAGVDLVVVFKVVIPLLFSVVPVGIYYVGRSLFAERVAAVAPFAFVFYYGFFKNMPHKQYVAEVFVVCILLVVFDERVREEVGPAARYLLGAGLVVTHYATTLLFVGFLSGLVGYRRVGDALVGRRRAGGADARLVGSLVVGFAAWYVLVGDGVIVAIVAEHAFATVSCAADVLSFPPFRSGADYLAKTPSTPLWSVYKAASVVLVAAMGVGVARSALRVALGVVGSLAGTRRLPADARTEYAVLAGLVAAVVAAGTVLPFGLGFDRILQIGLVVLAPYAVLGIAVAVELPRRLVGDGSSDGSASARVVAAFLVAYFLLSSGVAFVVAGEAAPPYSLAVTPNEENDEWRVYEADEVRGAAWTRAHAGGRRVGALGRGSHYKTKDLLVLLGFFDIRMTVSAPRAADGNCRFVSQETRLVPVRPTEAAGAGPAVVYMSRRSTAGWGDAPTVRTAAFRSYERSAGRVYHSGDAWVYVTPAKAGAGR